MHDHTLRIQEQVDSFHELLRSILSVNLTLETKALSEAGNKQNEEVKKISAWAAILFAPTIVGTVYGMNFEHMPELRHEVWLPDGARDDARRFLEPLPPLQTSRLDLSAAASGYSYQAMTATMR